MMNLGVTSTLTSHVVNEARVIWHRFNGPLALPNTTLPGEQTANAYFGADFLAPQTGLQNRYTGTDNLTWTRGAHTFKAGVKMDYVPWNALFSQFFFGEWQNTTCSFPMTPIGGACPPQTFTFGTGPAFNVAKDNVYAWFVQDSWKLRPNFTLNYGLRWDYEAGGLRGGRIPVNGSFANGCFQANGIIPVCSSDKNNFQPRIGFAWSPGFDSGLLGKVFGGRDKSVINAAFSEITQLAYNNVALDALNFDGINLRTVTVGSTDTSPSPAAVAALFASFPNFPAPAVVAPFVPPCPPSCGRVRPISPTIENPETRNVQLTWERELSGTMKMRIGYLGSFGFHQFGEFDTNYPVIQLDPAHSTGSCPSLPVAPLPNCYYFAGGRPDSRFLAERTNFSNRTAAYNGLVVSVEKRYANHLQLAGNYAWSHVFSSTEGFYGVSEPNNPFNVKASNRAPAETDARHLANFRITVDTDNRIHSMGFLGHVLNDWAFSVIGTAQSGRPWPISTGDGVFSGSIFPGFGGETTQAPNVLADGSLSTAGIAGRGANFLVSGDGASPGTAVCPTCMVTTFAAPAGASTKGPIDLFSGQPVDFQYLSGNVGRNQGVGDPYIRGDISLRRAFRIPFREGMRVELRADLFNVANHTNFWQFNSAPNLSQLLPCGSFNAAGTSFTPDAGCTGGGGLDVTTGKYFGNNGQPLTLTDLKHGRVSHDLNHPIFNGLGDPGGADIPRQAQFSLHVTF
jgi:TonB dependent receptor